MLQIVTFKWPTTSSCTKSFCILLHLNAASIHPLSVLWTNSQISFDILSKTAYGAHSFPKLNNNPKPFIGKNVNSKVVNQKMKTNQGHSF